jgi:hypothetical protein
MQKKMKLRTLDKLVADKHKFDFPEGHVPRPIEDLRLSLPLAEVSVVRVVLIATVGKQVKSTPSRALVPDFTQDPTLPRVGLSCPDCKTEEARVCTSVFAPRTLEIWSQCAACEIAFEVINAPDFPETSTFFEGVPAKDTVIARAQDAWASNRTFPFECTLDIRVPGEQDATTFTDIHSKDIYEKVQKVIHERCK